MGPKGLTVVGKRLPLCLPLFSFLFSVFFSACGVPGPPVPPTPKIPQSATELAAEQRGERVLLRWTQPTLHTDGTRLAGPPGIEIHRAFLKQAENWQQSFLDQAELAYQLPPSVVDLFTHNGMVVFPDVLGPGRLGQHAGETVVYGVKAVNDRRQAVGFSNLVVLRVYPVPVAIADGWARVTERAIELQWTAPARTSSGTPLEAIAGYQIYRSQSGEEGSFQLVGTSPTARYEDTQFSLGQRYVYRLRTLAQFGVETVESESSRPVEVEARDIFPPPAPGELVAIGSPGRIDLTWDASAASDLAGYFVYRRLESGQDYARLVGEPLRVQSFADTQVDPEKRYAYVVTAVDQTGNESPFSAEVVAEALAHNTAPAP